MKNIYMIVGIILMIPMLSPAQMPPDANDDYDTTHVDQMIKIQLLENDADPDNTHQELTVQLKTAPVNGSAVQKGKHFEYTPHTGFTGQDSLGYLLCDPGQLCDSAWVHITVLPGVWLDGIPDARKINFAPNPAADEVWMENLPDAEAYQASIYDIHGSLVLEQAMDQGVISTVELPEGLYFVKVSSITKAAVYYGRLLIER